MPILVENSPGTHTRPHPPSHDCSQEHSLDHWLEVYWMVEEDYLFSGDTLNGPNGPVMKKPIRSAVHHHKSALHR